MDLQVLSLAVGIIGLFSAAVFYVRSREKPKPRYQRGGLLVVGGDDIPGELEVLFRGQVVPRVALTNIVFWNDGRATLDREQLVEGDPLRIVVKEGRVLRADIVAQTREVNGLVVQIRDSGDAELSFDFLDPQDGARVSILHTGKRWQDAALRGTLKGVPRGVLFSGRIESVRDLWFQGSGTDRAKRIMQRYVIVIGVVFGVALVAGGWLDAAGVLDLDALFAESKPSLPWGGYVAMGVLYLALPTTMFWMSHRRFPKSLDTDVSEPEEKT